MGIIDVPGALQYGVKFSRENLVDVHPEIEGQMRNWHA